MNNKNSKKKDSFLKENGFLIGLYSLIGVLVVVALSITFFTPGNQSPDIYLTNNESEEPIAAVDNSLTKSYQETDGSTSSITETDNENFQATGNTLESSIVIEPDESNKIVEQTTNDSNKEDTKEDLKNDTEEIEVPEIPKEDNTTSNSNIEQIDNVKKVIDDEIVPSEVRNEEETTNNDSDSDKKDSEDNKTGNVIYEESSDTNVANTINEESDTYNFAYNNSKNMIWPALGDIVMAFSDDKLVYDETLEQYRTNDSISIASPVGTPVLAAETGKVTNIDTDNKNGNYVEIEHGNGWVTTYSQLGDELKVNVGDVINQGEIIGVVGVPSRYSVMLGSHLNFKVTENNVAVNPSNILK